MIYLVFSQEGINETIADIITDKADLWINPELLSVAQINELNQHKITVQFLAEFVDGSDVKGVLTALETIEKQNPKAEILVEYS